MAVEHNAGTQRGSRMRGLRWMRSLARCPDFMRLATAIGIAAFCSIGLAAPLLRAQDAAADWPMHNRDSAGTRYSPLADIDTGNVDRLRQVWSYRLQPGDFRFATAGGAAEVVPLVVDGSMYISTQTRVVALAPETGEEIWSYDIEGGGSSPRGVSFWPGDATHPARIFVTQGRNLIAVNAVTGESSTGFGDDGAIDMTVPYNGVPTIFDNVIVVGANTGELPGGPPGNTRAFDARTGEKLWEFQSVPAPGQPGNETWLNEGWRDRTGTNVWGWHMTVDDEREMVYMTFGSAAANYYGGDRPGANLFSNSVVALNVRSGEYVWHFQTVHHDLWDYDFPAAPVLVDVTVDGLEIPALAAIGKTGWMFILNRVTGDPMFGVEERPAPAGDVPGEWYSPTQPFPVKPPPLARMSLGPDDIVTAEDTTPEHAAACQALWDRDVFHNAGPFTPWLFHEEGDRPRVTVAFPGATGGASWGGLASDPATGHVFVQTKDNPLIGWIEVRGENDDGSIRYDRASGTVGAFASPIADADGRERNVPCYKPPWARLTGVDANTGDIVWQTTLGTNDALPEGKRDSGGSGSAGPMVTAGNLVFIGAATDARFRAFDAQTGQELWAGQLERMGNAVPVTYRARDGKQYVTITASDTVVTFALP